MAFRVLVAGSRNFDDYELLSDTLDKLLQNKGSEFLEYYYDYVEKIYNYQIPLLDIASKGKTAYCWAANLIPDDQWKNDYGASLLEYAQGQKDWDKVVKDAVDEWKVEADIVNNQ